MVFISYFSNQVLGKNEILRCIFVLYPVKLPQLNNSPANFSQCTICKMCIFFWVMALLCSITFHLWKMMIYSFTFSRCSKLWNIWYSADNSVLIHYTTALIFTLTGWVFDTPHTVSAIISLSFSGGEKKEGGVRVWVGVGKIFTFINLI